MYRRMVIGTLSDTLVLTLTRRNNGYKEPEMRLYAYIFSLLLAAVGYFTYGWAATAGSHWMAVAVGLCCMIAQQVSATSIATAYAMECFDQVRFTTYPKKYGVVRSANEIWWWVDIW